jgi:hypothetical protein
MGKEKGWDKLSWIVAQSIHVVYPTRRENKQVVCQSRRDSEWNRVVGPNSVMKGGEQVIG